MRSKAAAFATFWLDSAADAEKLERSKAFSIESRPKSTRLRVSLITQRRASSTAPDPAGFQKLLQRLRANRLLPDDPHGAVDRATHRAAIGTGTASMQRDIRPDRQVI